MTRQEIAFIAAELRRLTIRPRRYRAAIMEADRWRELIRRYGNTEKRIRSSASRWYIIRYVDGHEELTMLRVLQNGLFSGLSPAIYRGLLVPRLVDYATFSNVDGIRLAF